MTTNICTDSEIMSDVQSSQDIRKVKIDAIDES